MNAETTQTASESVATDSESDSSEEVVVSVRDLGKTYGTGDEAVTAVDGVSFDIDRGSVVGLLGPNGAGKTTTIKSILGLVLPSSGEVEIAGVDVHDDPKQAYRHVGATLEGARNVYWRLTVRENVEFFASLNGQQPSAIKERYEQLLNQFGLAEKADETVNDLSRGMKQKVSLVCTLARGTDVVFLDEPTLGLDVESSLELRRELRQLAEQEAITVVLSSHDMDVVEDLCERVVVMNDGNVVADDSVADLVEVFGTRSYRISVAGSIPDSTRAKLRERFPVESFERVGETERFDATLTEGDDLYAIFDALRAGDCSLDGVTATDPDLESVFLELTNEDGESDTARTPTETADDQSSEAVTEDKSPEATTEGRR